jgi:2-polyprenyl-3-methyl-5-hydroxy-6-metoxy-1,4-benzoquinol methylase
MKAMNWFTGTSLLEMGPAEGLSTKFLYEVVEDLEVVDASTTYINAIQSQFPAIKCHLSLFESFEPNRSFDNIYMGHVLEHVEDPGLVLARASTWLNPGGRVIASVPNADSIHRQIGVKLGLIKETNELNANDIQIGHRRVFRRSEFESIFRAQGFEILESSGFFLKFYANSDLESTFSADFINELMRIGEMSPSNAAELFLVASIPLKP